MEGVGVESEWRISGGEKVEVSGRRVEGRSRSGGGYYVASK